MTDESILITKNILKENQALFQSPHITYVLHEIVVHKCDIAVGLYRTKDTRAESGTRYVTPEHHCGRFGYFHSQPHNQQHHQQQQKQFII